MEAREAAEVLRSRIRRGLRQHGGEAALGELAAELGVPLKTVSNALRLLLARGRVAKVSHGRYRLVEPAQPDAQVVPELAPVTSPTYQGGSESPEANRPEATPPSISASSLAQAEVSGQAAAWVWAIAEASGRTPSEVVEQALLWYVAAGSWGDDRYSLNDARGTVRELCALLVNQPEEALPACELAEALLTSTIEELSEARRVAMYLGAYLRTQPPAARQAAA